jgi:magnesium chelatase accessory protein
MQAAKTDLADRVAPPVRSAPGRPDWAREGKDWPNREASRFIRAGGLRWHVQVAGTGPVLLLLHGTGAATHSWRDMLQKLSEDFTVVAPDLPGHGFTEQPAGAGMSLPGMARKVAALLDALGLRPEFAAGHSAGAAIAVQMCLDGTMAPRAVIALNGAMIPYGGHASSLFAPLARLIARNPLMPFVFAWRAADQQVVEKLLASTGSAVDPVGLKFYARLARHSGHTGAALAMMGNWDLAGFLTRLPKFTGRLVLVVGENDRSIPASDAQKVQAVLPAAEIIALPGLGHLAHEEEPALFVALLKEACR